MALQLTDMTSSSTFLDVALFLLTILITGPSFISICQFSFIRYWPKIWKSEIPPSAFCPISGDWGKLGISNMVRMSLSKCYWKLRNARVTTFTVSELLKENQQWRKGGGGKITHFAPRLGLMILWICIYQNLVS